MQQLACSAVTIPRSKLLWLQPAPRTLNCELRSFFYLFPQFSSFRFSSFFVPPLPLSLSLFFSSLFGTESTFCVTINERMKTCFFSRWSFCRGTCDGKEWIFGLDKKTHFFLEYQSFDKLMNRGSVIFGKLDVLRWRFKISPWILRDETNW